MESTNIHTNDTPNSQNIPSARNVSREPQLAYAEQAGHKKLYIATKKKKTKPKNKTHSIHKSSSTVINTR